MPENIASLVEKLSYSEVLGRAAKLARLLEDLGVPWEAWQWPIDDLAFRARLANYWRARGDIFAPYGIARLVLGDDLITPEEITDKRKSEPKEEGQEVVPLVYAPDQLVCFRRTLEALPLDYLKWLVEHNYVLVAGPPEPKNLLGVRELDASLFRSQQGGWYAGDEQKFSRDELAEAVWHAIRKDHVPNSTSKPYDKQCGLLLPEEQVPTAVKVAWVDTTYAKVRGVCLHNNIWVRTSSVTADRGRVYVRSRSDGFSVSYGTDDSASSDIGVSASR